MVAKIFGIILNKKFAKAMGRNWEIWIASSTLGMRTMKFELTMRENILAETHVGGLAGHFGRDKTLSLIKEHFYWPHLERDVARHIERCRTCHLAKTHGQNTGLYTPLAVLAAPWEDVSLDFVTGLP